jgi:N-formylmaleamate deformylase
MMARARRPVWAAVLLSFLVLRAASGDEEKPIAVEATGSGAPVILIPGLACGQKVWDGLVDRYRERFRFHRVTLAGFAGLPPVKGPLIERYRDAILAYIKAERLVEPIVIGHSLGGFLALSLAATRPEAVGAVVALDGVPHFASIVAPGVSEDAVRTQAQNLRTFFEGQGPLQFAFQNRLVLATLITDPKEVERVAGECGKSDPKAVGEAMYEILTADLREKVKSIRAPVLLIGAPGSVEPELRAKAEEVYRSQMAPIPRHKIVFAPKARHFIQLDEPELVYRELETFLKETRDAAKK